MLRTALALVGLACASACSSEQQPAGSGGAAGGAGGPATLQVAPYQWSDQGDGMLPIVDGSSIELWAAPQGGHVSRIGAKVAGLATDTALLVARLRDSESDAVVVESSRTAPMLPVPGQPEWKQPDPSSMYNVVHLPLCPDNDGRAIDATSYRLEVRVTELYGDYSEGAAEPLVTPTCSGDAALLSYCQCECAASYSPGKCAGDGGT